MLKDLAPALRFLTIIPLPGGGRLLSEREITRSAAAFVLVGLLQGALLLAVHWAASLFLTPDLGRWLVVLTLTLIGGGFHLDGLADSFDALGVKSCGDRERDRVRRLEVMKDSATGAMGMMAIFFALIFKFSALQNLALVASPPVYALVLLLFPALGKWAMLLAMYQGTPARPDGLGRLFIGAVGGRELAWGGATLALPILFFAWSPAAKLPSYYHLFLMLLLPLALLSASRMMVALARRRFGGITGDSLGAINEISEIISLLLVIVWLQLSVW